MIDPIEMLLDELYMAATYKRSSTLSCQEAWLLWRHVQSLREDSRDLAEIRSALLRDRGASNE